MQRSAKHHNLNPAAASLLCLLLAASPALAAENAASAETAAKTPEAVACPAGWQGEYDWDETAPALSGMNSYWGYSLSVVEEKGNCQARVEGDGVQMERRILADVRGDEHEIVFIYREMLPDAGFGSAGEPGDRLFRLKREGGTIITHWETMQPQLEQHEKPGVYYRPTQAKPGAKP